MFKNKKMAGHLGTDRITTQNLTVVRTDVERGLILVKGAVSGHDGSFVEIRDAVKKAPAEGRAESRFRFKSADAPAQTEGAE